MDDKVKKDFTDFVKAIIPEITETQLNGILTFAVNYMRKRDNEISLQNIAIIATTAWKKKSFQPRDIIGAVRLDQMMNAGVDAETINFLADAMGEKSPVPLVPAE